MQSAAIILSFAAIAIAEDIIKDKPYMIHSDEARGVGHSDEDTVANEVFNIMEKTMNTKSTSSIRPLPVKDVKCFMSVDRHCSKDMGKIKGVLIQAVKENCAKCTEEEKEKAGKVMASLMTYDPVAWKHFLTRYAGLPKIERIRRYK